MGLKMGEPNDSSNTPSCSLSSGPQDIQARMWPPSRPLGSGKALMPPGPQSPQGKRRPPKPQGLPPQEWVPLGRPRPRKALRQGQRPREPGPAQALRMEAAGPRWESGTSRLRKAPLGTGQRPGGWTLSGGQDPEARTLSSQRSEVGRRKRGWKLVEGMPSRGQA